MTDEVKVLSDDALREIEARAAVLPEGPWYEEVSTSEHPNGVRLKYRGVRLFPLGQVPTGYGGIHADTNYPDGTAEGDNATNLITFLAHAREDIPALCATVRALRRDTERTYTPSIVEALRLLDGAGYGKEVPNSLSDMIKKVLAERDNLLSRSHQTVNFECGCVFRQDGLDAEPQLIEHCTLWAEMERNAMIDTIAESEKENTALREQLAEAQAHLREQRETIKFWQRHIARMGKLLGTVAMDTEVEDAVQQLQSQLAQVTQERLTDEERKILIDHHYYEADKAITRYGDKVGQHQHLERLAIIRNSKRATIMPASNFGCQHCTCTCVNCAPCGEEEQP